MPATQTLITGKVTFVTHEREQQFLEMLAYMMEYGEKYPGPRGHLWFEFRPGEILPDSRRFSIRFVSKVNLTTGDEVTIIYEGFACSGDHEGCHLYSGMLTGDPIDAANWQYEFVILS